MIKHKIGTVIIHTNAINVWASLHFCSDSKNVKKNGQIAPAKCCALAVIETAKPLFFLKK